MICLALEGLGFSIRRIRTIEINDDGNATANYKKINRGGHTMLCRILNAQ